MSKASRAATVMRKALPAVADEGAERAKRVAVEGATVIGLEVPHAHIHLIPIQHVDDINFSRAKLKLSSERLQEIADKIRSNYSAGG